MEFHPSKIPIFRTFDVKDEKQATEAAHEMVMIGFDKEEKGFKVLMPKENEKTAKKIYDLSKELNIDIINQDQFLKIVKDITSKGFVRSDYKRKLVDLSDIRINLKGKK